MLRHVSVPRTAAASLGLPAPTEARVIGERVATAHGCSRMRDQDLHPCDLRSHEQAERRYI